MSLVGLTAFVLREYKLIFADGSTEKVETISLWLAWFKGKLRAAEKGTVLLKIEEPGAGEHSASSFRTTYYFDLPTADKAVELETLLYQVSEGKARVVMVDRAQYRVRVEAEVT